MGLLSKRTAASVPIHVEVVPASSYLVEEADIRSTLGLDQRWVVNEPWLQWAHNQLTAPSGNGSLSGRLVRLIATWLDAHEREWIEQVDVFAMARVVFGLLENIATEDITSEIRVALDEAVSSGWLREEEYDDWRPGMRSGTGMRDKYALTPLGKKVITEAGYQPHPPESIAKRDAFY
jgi:hypothetical protein